MLIVDARTLQERSEERALSGNDVLHVPFPKPASLKTRRSWKTALETVVSAVNKRLTPHKTVVAVYCKKGIRSARVATHLSSALLNHPVRVLDWGGIDDTQSKVYREWAERMQRAWRVDGGLYVWSTWFGRPTTRAAESRMRTLWFPPRESAAQRESDSQMNAPRMATLARRAAAGELDHWAKQPHGNARLMVAWVVLRDQIPRHLYRGTQRAFQLDSSNVQMLINNSLPLFMPWLHGDCRGKVCDTKNRRLTIWEVGFALMPFQHHESSASQMHGLYLHAMVFKHHPSWTSAQRKRFKDTFWHHQKKHALIIQKFGQFPSRDRAMNRSKRNGASAAAYMDAYRRDRSRHV